MPQCDVCNEKLIPPQNPTGARLAVIGDRPAPKELLAGKPYPASFGMGRVLRAELRKGGINFEECLVTYMWPHGNTDDENERCFDWNFGQTLKLVRKMTHVLLLGSEVSQVFLEANVSDIAGLFLPCTYLPKARVMAAPGPKGLLMGSLGEFRWAAKKLGKDMKHVK